MSDSQAGDDDDGRATQIGGDHYRRMAIQPWDAMAAWMTPAQFTGFLRGNAIKYIARAEKKGGTEDYRKAIHYLQRLIAHIKQGNENV